jgi:ABC-type lipoprotein release transport system permease subunit
MLIIALPLIGVIITLFVTNFTTQRAEDRRAKNLVHVQVLEAGRHAELEALYATAEFITKLKKYNAMLAIKSVAREDDEPVVNALLEEALQEFVDSFNGFDSLTRAALTVEALGAKNVAILLQGVRSEALDYMKSLGPIFLPAHGSKFEERVDSLMRNLVDEVRLDSGTDEARAGYQSKKKVNRDRD